MSNQKKNKKFDSHKYFVISQIKKGRIISFVAFGNSVTFLLQATGVLTSNIRTGRLPLIDTPRQTVQTRSNISNDQRVKKKSQDNIVT